MKVTRKSLLNSLMFGAAWTLAGAIFALPYLMRGGGWTALIAVMLNWQIWGALAPFIRAYDARLPTPPEHWRIWLGAHLAFGLIISLLYVLATATIEYYFRLNKWNPWKEYLGLVDWYFWAILIYCLIVCCIQAIKYYRRHLRDELRIARLERRFAETRLQVLRAQLDPHFLFNALNGISAEVERDPRSSRKMIEHLADLLRLSLQVQTSQTVPLEQELAFLEPYIALQKLRFGDRIRFYCEVAPETRKMEVPSLLLQPLVENAVRHGVGSQVDGGDVWISIELNGEDLVVRVEDNGVGLPVDWSIEPHTGLGLSSTQERLQSLYPNGRGGLKVYPRPEGGVVAEARIPIERSNGHVDVAA